MRLRGSGVRRWFKKEIVYKKSRKRIWWKKIRMEVCGGMIDDYGV